LAPDVIGVSLATGITMIFPPEFSKSAPLMLESFGGQLERKKMYITNMLNPLKTLLLQMK
jgi:hypothetical protein